MKLAILGCTHGMHESVSVPDADVLIHTGDFTGRRTSDEVLPFAKWVGSQSHEHKIVICGNHDSPIGIGDKFRSIFESFGVAYLQDSSITIDGLLFYGSPWSPTFYNWYWMRDRGKEIAQKWARIDGDTDVLITHGPADSLDTTEEGMCVGCKDLQRELSRVQPKVHCFSHIHEASGMFDHGDMISVNASIVSRDMRVVNPVRVVELGGGEG